MYMHLKYKVEKLSCLIDDDNELQTIPCILDALSFVSIVIHYFYSRVATDSGRDGRADKQPDRQLVGIMQCAVRTALYCLELYRNAAPFRLEHTVQRRS
jgi:hypothetical protein